MSSYQLYIHKGQIVDKVTVSMFADKSWSNGQLSDV